MTRRCGPCSACCTALAVAALDLAEGERCKHQRNGLVMFEVWPDAHIKSDRARDLIARASELVRVIIVRPGGMRTVIDNRRKGTLLNPYERKGKPCSS